MIILAKGRIFTYAFLPNHQRFYRGFEGRIYTYALLPTQKQQNCQKFRRYALYSISKTKTQDFWEMASITPQIKTNKKSDIFTHRPTPFYQNTADLEKTPPDMSYLYHPTTPSSAENEELVLSSRTQNYATIPGGRNYFSHCSSGPPVQTHLHTANQRPRLSISYTHLHTVNQRPHLSISYFNPLSTSPAGSPARVFIRNHLILTSHCKLAASDGLMNYVYCIPMPNSFALAIHRQGCTHPYIYV